MISALLVLINGNAYDLDIGSLRTSHTDRRLRFDNSRRNGANLYPGWYFSRAAFIISIEHLVPPGKYPDTSCMRKITQWLNAAGVRPQLLIMQLSLLGLAQRSGELTKTSTSSGTRLRQRC